MRESVSDEASAATGSPRPQRIRRWLRRILVAIAALALGSVVIALVVLHTDWGREQLRRQAVSALAEMFPGGFELDGIEGSVLGTVTLRDLVIYDQKRRRAVAVERVSIDLGMVALLRHTIRLERLDIEGLTVRAFDDDQGLNLTALVRPRQSDSASTWRVQLDDVRLERGAFAVTKPSADLSGKPVSDHFDDIAVRSTATIDPGGSVTSSVTIGLRWRERNVTAELHGSVKLNDGVVEVARADARVGSVRATVRELRLASLANVTGSLEVNAAKDSLRELIPALPTQPATTITVKVSPQAAEVLRATLHVASGDATLSGEIALRPLLAKPQATGEFQLHNLEPAVLLGPDRVPELAGVRLTRASFGFEVAAVGNSLSVDGVAGSVRCSAELADRSGTRLPLNLKAQLQNRRLAATATGSIGTSQLSATVDVTVGQHQRLQVHQARLRGHLAAKDLPAQIPAVRTLAGVVDIDLKAQGNVDLGTLTAPEVPAPRRKSPWAAPRRKSPWAAPPPSVAPAAPGVTEVADLRSAFSLTGIVDGSGFRFRGYAADRLHVGLSSTVVGARPRGNILAKVAGIRATGQRIPNLELRATAAATGVINVDVRLRGGSDTEPSPRRRPGSGTVLLLAALADVGAIDLSVSIRPDRGYRGADIALRHFRGALPGLEVSAKTGQLSLRPNRQEVRGLRLRSNAGTIAIDAVRTGTNVTAAIAIDQLELSPLAVVAPQLAGLHGRVQLRGSGSWRGNALDGTVRGQIVQLVARPGAAPIDIEVAVSAARQLFQLQVQARSARLGEISIGADVAPPPDFASTAAWQALDRRAVRRLSIRGERVDLGALQHVFGQTVLRTELASPRSVAGGTAANDGNRTANDQRASLDGRATIDLEFTAASGALRVSVAGLEVPGTPAAMDLNVEGEFGANGRGDIRATARMATIVVNATAALRIPDRPFSSAAWRVPSERVARATLEVPRFVITDSLAAMLGLGTWRGQASARFDLQLDANTASGHVALLDLRGGPLQRPIEWGAELTTGSGAVHIVGRGKIDGIPAADLVVDLPLPFIAAGAGVGATRAFRWADLPLTGEIRFGPVPAAGIARLLGAAAVQSRLASDSTAPVNSAAALREATTYTASDERAESSAVRSSSSLQGTVRGDVKLAGSLGAPDLRLNLQIADLGSQRSKIRELRLVGRYVAGAVHAELSGANDKAGHLQGSLDLVVGHPADARIAVSASAFELSPLARLAPVALLGVTARLDGALEVRGLVPKQMQVAGNLTLSSVRLPLANQVGALTNATIRLEFAAGRLTVGVQGDIEAGKVTATASAALDGIVPRSGTLDLKLSDLALIAPMTPTVGATLHVNARVLDGRWILDARLTDGMIRIPAEEGRVLHPISPPSDVAFVANARNVGASTQRVAQSPRNVASRARSPWLEVALSIESVAVRTAEATGTVRGAIKLDIADNALATSGIIRLTGGDVLLFGRRYQIARAALTFDGPLDPTVDAELRHDFPQLTLTAMITGRTTKPKFHFRSSPSDYTEAQLLSFFLGGNPSASGRDVQVANSVAAAVASQTLGAMVTRQLPVRLDVLSYQPQTTASSGALVAGRWITEQLLLLVRNRTNPRPLENGAEGELQYWLRRGLLLDGVAGDRGTLGLDLLWNRRW